LINQRALTDRFPDPILKHIQQRWPALYTWSFNWREVGTTWRLTAYSSHVALSLKTASLTKNRAELHTVFSHPVSSFSSSNRLSPLSSDSADQCLTHLIQLGGFRTIYTRLVVLIRNLDTLCGGWSSSRWGVEEAT